jgi:hypothetical protein
MTRDLCCVCVVRVLTDSVFPVRVRLAVRAAVLPESLHTPPTAPFHRGCIGGPPVVRRATQVRAAAGVD